MTREEERALAAAGRAQGLEFVRRRFMRETFHPSTPASLRAVAGPPAALREGEDVVFERPSDGALKRYRVGSLLWEGQGRDGNPRVMRDLVYVRRTVARPYGTCPHCKGKRRTTKMRCPGSGRTCEPTPPVSPAR